MNISTEQVCGVLLEALDERTRDIVARRFGLGNPGAPETLESIGGRHGITRERVRQIVLQGLREARELAELRKQELALLDLEQAAEAVLRDRGYVRREDAFLRELDERARPSSLLFLLELAPGLERHRETDEHHAYWTNRKDLGREVPAILRQLADELEQRAETLADEELWRLENRGRVSQKTLFSSLEVSKLLLKGYDGRWGLRHWPEVNPRGVREKAHIVLRRTQAPLHFREIASGIERLQQELLHTPQRPALPQTVHNELIKDDRFVLVGRGVYALAEWGYMPGTVKDVLCTLLAKARRALEREEILRAIAEQRQVKESTVVLNLQDKALFGRDSRGRYFLQNR